MKRLVLTLALISLGACGGGNGMPTGATQLEIVDVTVGTGATAANGDTVTVNYILSLTNGTQVESSYTSRPITFQLGAHQVIAGFEQGIVGMRVGGKRQLTIPPSLGYGINPQGSIPGNSTLIFQVELVSIAGK